MGSAKVHRTKLLLQRRWPQSISGSSVVKHGSQMKQVFRGRHTVLSNHHFRIRIVYSLNHPFSGFSGFKIEGYCTVHKIKRRLAPLIVRHCLSVRNVVSLNSFETGTSGTLITTNVCVCACVCVCVCARACTRVLSEGWLFTTPWTVSQQAPLPMGF